jgi:selenocysteine lyase/cysteine desulfurase
MMRVLDELTIAAAQELWSPSGSYLNTASFGLPPRPGWDALQAALADWREGRTSWEQWGEATESARAGFARLVGVTADRVAVGATVSGLVGSIAASIPDGAHVLAPEIEFTSTLFPFLVQAGRGVTVRTVPAEALAASIDSRVDVVAFSAVQMATGEVADLAAIRDAARRHGALTVCDATQACGWLALDAGDFDFLVCAAYKWLMCPRGVAFLAVAPERLSAIVPTAAGWYAGADVHGSYFGPPLRLADDARRLDSSPAWFSWVGAAPALALVERLGVPAIHAHNLELADTLRSELDLPPGDSAIVSLDAGEKAAERLARTGVRAAVRGGRLRLSFHVYNTLDDVRAAVAGLAGGRG